MGNAAIVLAIAAVGGIAMVALRLRGRPLPPMWLALLHGGVAFAGLLYLYIVSTGAIIAQQLPAPSIAFAATIGFIFAALGGSTLFLAFHLRKKPLPLPLIFAHASVAIISFILLLVAVGH